MKPPSVAAARYPLPAPLRLAIPVLDGEELFGCQTPRIEILAPGEADALADSFIELARVFGISALPWQEHAVRAIIRRRASGDLVHDTLGLVASRRQGKNVVLFVLEIGALFLVPEWRRIAHSAHEFRSAKDHVEQLHRILANAGQDFFTRHQVTLRRSNEEFSISLVVDGVPKKITALARTNDSGRGLEFDLLIVDEALKLTDEHAAALFPLTMAVPNSLTIFTSSQAYTSAPKFLEMRRAAISGETPDIGWIEWSAPAGADTRSLEALRQANPSLGYLVRLATARAALGQLGEAKYRVEILGIVEEAYVEVPEISMDSWRDQITSTPFPYETAPLALGIDRSGPNGDTALYIAAGPDSLTYVDRVDHRAGDPIWVVDLVEAMLAKFPNIMAVAIDDGSVARELEDEFTRRDIRLTKTNSRTISDATHGFVAGVHAGTIFHYGGESLTVAVHNGFFRSIGAAANNRHAWDRAKAKASITPLVASSLATWALTASAAVRPTRRRPVLPAAAASSASAYTHQTVMVL